MSTLRSTREGQVAHQITSLTPDKRRITKDINSIKNIDVTNNEIGYSKKKKNTHAV
jgi:hypothetical protein